MMGIANGVSLLANTRESTRSRSCTRKQGVVLERAMQPIRIIFEDGKLLANWLIELQGGMWNPAVGSESADYKCRT
jgi:hypothetical protein